MDPERTRQDQIKKPAPTGEDDLLGVIADVEKQLDSLRSVRAEREEHRQRMGEREAALKQAEASLEEARRGLAQREADVSTRSAAFREEREQLDRDLRALADEQKAASAAVEAKEADLRGRAATVEQREQRLAESASAVSRERETIEAKARDLAQRENELRTAAASIERERQRMTELTARTEKAEAAAKQLAEEATGLRQQSQAASKRAEEMGAEIVRAKSETTAVQQQLQAAGKRLEEVNGELSRSKAEIERKGSAAAALKTEIDAKAKELLASGQRAAAAEKRVQEVEGAAHKHEARITELQQQLSDREAKVTELSERLDGARERFRSVSKSLQEQADLVGQANALEAELRQREAQVAELEAKLAQAPAASTAAQSNEHIEKLQSTIGDLTERLKQASSRGDQDAGLRVRVEELTQKLERAVAVNDQLRGQAEQFKAHLKDAAAKGKGQGQIPAQVGQAIVTRWRRLRVMRTLLHEQGEKLKNGGEALRTRFEQCEQLLAQRDELVAARNAMNETKRRVEKLQATAARGKSVATVFHAVGIFVALAALSWVFAGQIAPATYAARAVIAAETAGKDVAEDQLAEWQRYHESLFTDARIIEVAAERMGRRGIVSLSEPGVLTARLNSDMSHESGVAGEITVELRGPGESKATRELETYVTALVSQANAGKEHRSDGLATNIKVAANTLGGPISDMRPVFAAAIFAANLAVFSLLGTVVWRRLAAAKIKFENEGQIEAALTNAAWERAARVQTRSEKQAR